MEWNEFRDYVRQALGWVVRFSRVAGNTADGGKDTVEGRATGSDEQSYAYLVRRIWPFGIRSRPPAGCDAVVVHANAGSSNGVMVGAESTRYGPSDLKDGEVCLYNKGTATVKLDENDQVVVNGGSIPVAREGDAVARNNAMATWMSAVEAALSAAGSPTASPWSGVSPQSSNIALVAEGAENFRA